MPRRSYVGFTVDPPHRLKQHNGLIQGGAFKTHKYRPWDMTLVVHGFPTRKFALQFEWTWHNPTFAKSTKGINWAQIKEDTKNNDYAYNIRILKELLCIDKWRRLSLHICVTLQDVYQILSEDPQKISVSQLTLGSLDELMEQNATIPTPGQAAPDHCYLCKNHDPPPNHPNYVVCPFCNIMLHLRCLAHDFISKTPDAKHALIPTHGICPGCSTRLEWRDLVELRNQFCENIVSEPRYPSDDDEDL